MNLWIGNLAPEVTDEDLKSFVGKYGCPAERRLFVQTTLRSALPRS
jgi:RNA recognition motif-containing protein